MGTYKLVKGTFPLSTYKDTYKFTKTPHTFQNTESQQTYKLNVTGFSASCSDGKFSNCEIKFGTKNESGGGRRRSSNKRPTARRRRSSKRKARKARSTRRR